MDIPEHEDVNGFFVEHPRYPTFACKTIAIYQTALGKASVPVPEPDFTSTAA
jgi:hypothetical protein